MKLNPFKKLFSIMLVCLFLMTSSGCCFLTKNSSPCKLNGSFLTSQTANIPAVLEQDMKDSIVKVYGEDKKDEIYCHITKLIDKTKNERTLGLYKEDFNRDDDWYKNEVVYMFYADQFGTKDGEPSQFEDLIGMLDYLKDLGVTTIYVLPFLDSPMGDAGFDVRDYRNVREDLGGMKQFLAFVKEARAKGFKIKADLILNHVSDQHRWFQQALNGDVKMLEHFVYTDKMPEYKKYRDESIGIVVEYDEGNDISSKRRLIFPDICENNYRKVNIKGKDYFIYHTFYPFQPDLNWENPDVLYEMLDVIAFWGNKGVDIFRLDAIPYLIKEKGTNAENLPKTHALIKLISAFIQATAPKSVAQAEACQWPKDILPYLGKQRKVDMTILGQNKPFERTDEVQIAYHFPYMPAIWASLLTSNNEHFWKAYDSTPQIPDLATWALFLRVHDELTLEMVDVETRKIIYDNLIKNGAEFREGFGVSGRMANFLDNNPDKIGVAFSILLSLPGLPIIYYGDEIGAQNNFEYAKAFAKQREETQKAKGSDLDVKSYFDSRDINRGPISKDSFYNAMKGENPQTSKIYNRVKKLIALRKSNPVITRGDFAKVDTDCKSLFGYLRTLDNENILVIHNLSDKEQKASLEINADNMFDLISKQEVEAKKEGNATTFNVPANTSMWLKF